MKKAIKQLHIAFLAALLITTASCKKFLDQQPQDAADEPAVFENANTALQAVLGVYSRMAGDNGFGTNLSVTYPFDTDEMIGFLQGAVTDGQRAMNSYTTVPGNALLAPTFIRLYNGIERANICIYNIPLMPAYTTGSDAVKRDLARLHGESLALRALFYFELIKLWGDVPATYVPATQLSNFDLPKTNRDTIYNHIIEDLRVAAELVPWRNESGVVVDERLTKGGVKALRARIALFRGGYSLRRESRQMERPADYLTYYSIARNECFDIMQRSDIHKLNPIYASVWRDALLAGRIESNGEVLFEVAHGGETAESDGKIGSWNSIRVTSGSTFGNARNVMMPTYFYSFAPYDLRRDVTCAPLTITNGNYVATTIIGILDGKWRRDWITPTIPLNTGKTYYGINWPLIRYSDVLLMFAEAENELTGPTTDAITAVNNVRRRAWSVRSVKSVTIGNGGAGYTTIPTVTITGGGGTGARAVARIASGAITNIDLIDIGTNYTSTPTVTVSGGGGTGFTGTVQLTALADADLLPAQTSDKIVFLNAIQNERLLEFGSEGIRKYDLIRWNMLGSKITEARGALTNMVNRVAPYNNLPLRMFYQNNNTSGIFWGNSLYAPAPTATPSGYTAVNWIQGVTTTSIIEKFATGFTANKSELFPIPQTVIEASHGSISQDYGY